MQTRPGNRLKWLGAPDMAPSQLSSAGLSRTPAKSRKRMTKDQEIAALKDELRAVRELIANSRSDIPAERDDQAQDDTDLATDVEETQSAAVGTKHKATGQARSTSKLKRARAVYPFESSSMVHSGATGLVDDWRTRIAAPYSPASSQSLTLDLQTPGRNILPHSPMSSTSMTLMSTPSPVSMNFEETSSLPVFLLPKIVDKSKVFPGIKDLPDHIRPNFRNEFIRFVIKRVANSESPWTNPDVPSIQAMYQLVYPAFPARVRNSDAVYHPTITSLGVLRNHIAAAAVTAVQRHLPGVFRKKKYHTLEARAKYITQLFVSDTDHPIIWQEYIEGDIQNHPEVGGYKTIRRGVFQSDPILETFLSYYSSSGIMELPPTEDPGPGNRPLGILALVTAAVERAYKMYATGDFIVSTQQFNAEAAGPRTTRYLDNILNDLDVKHWNLIFVALSTFSIKTETEEAVRNGAPERPLERVPLPPSNPPSPRND